VNDAGLSQVDPGDVKPLLVDFLREEAVAAAGVKDPAAGPKGCQLSEHGLPQVGVGSALSAPYTVP
jgi:hypothetical protein